jgi:hypothetical protein
LSWKSVQNLKYFWLSSRNYFVLARAIPRRNNRGGGVHIHIFVFSPTDYFWKRLFLYVIIHPLPHTWIYTHLPQLSRLGTALVLVSFCTLHGQQHSKIKVNLNIENFNTILINAVKLTPYLNSKISETYWTSDIIFSLAYHLKSLHFSIILQIKH